MSSSQSTNTQGAAQFLGVSAETVKQDRKAQKLKIPFYRVGRSVRYLVTDLENYIEQHRVAA